MFSDFLDCFFATLKFLYLELGGPRAATFEQSNDEQTNRRTDEHSNDEQTNDEQTNIRMTNIEV